MCKVSFQRPFIVDAHRTLGCSCRSCPLFRDKNLKYMRGKRGDLYFAKKRRKEGYEMVRFIGFCPLFNGGKMVKGIFFAIVLMMGLFLLAGQAAAQGVGAGI